MLLAGGPSPRASRLAPRGGDGPRPCGPQSAQVLRWGAAHLRSGLLSLRSQDPACRVRQAPDAPLPGGFATWGGLSSCELLHHCCRRIVQGSVHGGTRDRGTPARSRILTETKAPELQEGFPHEVVKWSGHAYLSVRVKRPASGGQGWDP